MENVIFLCFFGSFLVPFGADGQSTESIDIQNCTGLGGFLDIRENTNNTIVCNAFDANTTIAWFIKRKDSTENQEIAMCGPLTCTVNMSTHFAALRFPEESHLFYLQHNVSLDVDTDISCATKFETSRRVNICHFNVINPATLSDCVVEEDRKNGRVKGSCGFDNALSTSRGLTCKWYRENTEQSRVTYTGGITITRTTSGGHEGGQCTFSSMVQTWENTTYIYSVEFYPGKGLQTIHMVKEGTGVTDTSLLPGGNIIGTSRQTPKDSDVPVAAIAGGVVAAVAVIIVIVVVVIIIVFRKQRRQKPSRNAHGPDNNNSTNNADFEEPVNPMYVTSGDQDDTDGTDHKPSATALRIPSGAKNGTPAPPTSLDADLYTTVDGEVANSVDSATNGDRFGGYEDIEFGSNQQAQRRRKDEYAEVDKSKAQKGPASVAVVIASPVHTTEGSDEYAVVDKSSSRKNAAKNVSPVLPSSDTNNAGADVYAQVNKSAKTDKAFEPETEGAAYAQVQKPKPAAKPGKPSSKTDVAQRGAADDDEYHTLSHTRGSPLTQGQAELESQYSHVGNVST